MNPDEITIRLRKLWILYLEEHRKEIQTIMNKIIKHDFADPIRNYLQNSIDYIDNKIKEFEEDIKYLGAKVER